MSSGNALSLNAERAETLRLDSNACRRSSHRCRPSPRPHRARARDSRRVGARGTFEQLREQNRGGPRWQLHRRPGHREQDAGRPHGLGPHAQGRLPALQGAARLRPALPERLRLPGPLDRGRRRARARAQLEAGDRGVRPRRVRAPLPRGRRPVVERDHARSKRLGQWMDWGNDYFTFCDTNIEYIWRFLKSARARLALPRPPLDRVVPALRHVALAARADSVRRLPGSHRPVALRPLPAARPAGRVARRLDDDAVDASGERGGRGQARRRVRAARERRVGRRRARTRTSTSSSGARAPSSSAWRTQGRSTTSPPAADVEHRVIPWDEVSLDEGTGIVHIAPGAGPRTSTWRASTTCPCSRRSTRRAASTTTTAGCTASPRPRPPTRSSADLAERAPARGRDTRAPLPALLAPRHAAHLAHRRRLVHLGRRPSFRALLAANATVVDAAGTSASAWRTGFGNMGDWNISRRRYYGLPLPFYPCGLRPR